MMRLRFGLAGRLGFLLFSALGLALAGCGGEPFDTVPVGGTLKYEDGSLIQADRVTITFVPQGVEASGKDFAPSAQGEVNVADGTFSSLTSRNPGDGAVVGRHKVVVQAIKIQNGVEMRVPELPQQYTNVNTTPLEVEVPAGGKGDFNLVIKR